MLRAQPLRNPTDCYGSTMDNGRTNEHLLTKKGPPSIKPDEHRGQIPQSSVAGSVGEGDGGDNPGERVAMPLYSIAVGQLIALFIVGTGAGSTLIDKYSGMHAPAAQNAPNYLILSFFLMCRPMRRHTWWSSPTTSLLDCLHLSRKPQQFSLQDSIPRHALIPTSATVSPMADPTSACEVEVGEQREEGEEEEPEKEEEEEEEEEQDEWWRYALLSLVDVEANVLCVWAYQYTSITSAMLLDCFTIPCVMVLSCLLLGARYERAHFAGALLCFAGVGLIVASDLQNNGSGSDDDDGDDHNNDDNEYPHAWLGDLMCVCGAFLYAVSNVVQERWVRAEAGPPRFLGRLGLCGVAVSGLQAALFERAALVEHTHWCLAGVGAWAGYTVALSAAYTVTSWFLVDADAALFNLSLLTADVYAVVFAYFVQGNLVSVLYAPAFGCTMAGIFVYHRAPKPTFAHTRRAAAAANTAFSAAAAFAPTASAAAAIDPTPAAEPAAEAPTERAVRLSE